MKAKKISILYAEDNKIQINLLSTVLENYQLDFSSAPLIELTIVETGTLAVEAALKKDFNMIFLDIEMPEKDGIQVLKEILGTKSNAYVVMITSHSTEENVHKALELGAKGFIVKPYRFNKLISIIQTYTKKMRKKPSH